MKSKIFSNRFHSKKGNELSNDQFIKELSSEANKKFLNKQYESVVALTDKILLIDQDRYDALTLRAMSLESLGYYLDALDDYDKVIKLRPSDGNIIGLCGLCYKSIGDFKRAREYLELSVNKGMKMYTASLDVMDAMSERTLQYYAESKNTPEIKKRRTDMTFTISNEAVNLNSIYDSLKVFYSNAKNALNLDPENKYLKELVDHYNKYFEET